ncbi:hypothetical protein ACRQ5D_23840 [Mucilaginibacter sp. P25]
MKKIILAFLLCVMFSVASWGDVIKHRVGKMALHVLYVGYDPAKPKPEHITYYSTAAGAVDEAWKTRMADFKTF